MADLQMILFKRRNGQYKLAACRGENKGCVKMRALAKPKKPCEDCVVAEDEAMTIGEFYDLMNRGDT